MKKIAFLLLKTLPLFALLWEPSRRFLLNGVSAVVRGGMTTLRAGWASLAETEAGERLGIASTEVSLVAVPILAVLGVAFFGWVLVGFFPGLAKRHIGEYSEMSTYMKDGKLRSRFAGYRQTRLGRLFVSNRWR